MFTKQWQQGTSHMKEAQSKKQKTQVENFSTRTPIPGFQLEILTFFDILKSS